LSQPDNTDRIKRRRAAIANRLARLGRLELLIAAEKPKLIAEDKELASVEATLSRLANVSDDDLLRNIDVAADIAPSRENEDEAEFEADSAAATDAAAASIPRLSTPRPSGIPTTPQMLDILLAEAERAGKQGLVGRDLVVGIRQRWWPGVGWNSILPTAFALVAKGRLDRKGKLFVRLRQQAQGAAQAELLRH
jgi:hypothetical protein